MLEVGALELGTVPLAPADWAMAVAVGERVEEEARSGAKRVDLLLVSCRAARLLRGARTTSCKSAKDRTSMFHTLEFARAAQDRGLLER